MARNNVKTLRTCALLCALAGTAALGKGTPQAELGEGARSVRVTIGGKKARQFRVATDNPLTLTVTGPARVSFAVRGEGAAPAPAEATVEVDGEVARKAMVGVALDPAAKSDKGTQLTGPTRIVVKLKSGSHRVVVRWPARGDALVAVAGLKLLAPRVATALPLPLPVAAPPPLPLPQRSEPSPAPPPQVAAKAEPPGSQPPAAVRAPTAAPTPVASILPRVNVPPPARSGPLGDLSPGRPDAERPYLALSAGFERNTEQFIDSSGLAHFGLEAIHPVSAAFAVLQLDLRTGRQAYASGKVSPAGADVVRLDEQRFDAFLGLGYDFAPLFAIGDLTAAPVLGLKYIRLQNNAYPADLFGVDLGGRLRYGLSQAFGIHGAVSWMYNLIHPAAFSATGTPLSQLGFRAGFDFPLSGGYALSLDYQGDVLAFDFSYRVAHGASAGFGKSF